MPFLLRVIFYMRITQSILTNLLSHFLSADSSCLKNVTLVVKPPTVMEGQDTTLQCFYDLEGIPLYSVKWYRGRHEFYRFSPSEHPSSKIFPIPGIDVDVS
jgi:hypothetical protein